VTQTPDDAVGDGAEDGAGQSPTGTADNGQGMTTSPPRTGDPAVDAALSAAAAVQNADPADQLDAYVGTHRALQDRLADSGA
jgi:hypothetical protein